MFLHSVFSLNLETMLTKTLRDRPEICRLPKPTLEDTPCSPSCVEDASARNDVCKMDMASRCRRTQPHVDERAGASLPRRVSRATLVGLRRKRTLTSEVGFHTAAAMKILQIDSGHEPGPVSDVEQQQHVLFFDGGARDHLGPRAAALPSHEQVSSVQFYWLTRVETFSWGFLPLLSLSLQYAKSPSNQVVMSWCSARSVGWCTWLLATLSIAKFAAAPAMALATRGWWCQAFTPSSSAILLAMAYCSRRMLFDGGRYPRIWRMMSWLSPTTSSGFQ
jgi:hypothetical protein